MTALIVFGPLVALGYAAVRFWGSGITLLDVILAAVLYTVAGHGVTVGFHRLFAHRSFTANRPLKVALAVAGSLSFQGAVIGWVGDHRRHHAHSDRDGDPHSPYRRDGRTLAPLRGLWHAHTGWLFASRSDTGTRRPADLAADRDLVVIDRLFPLWCVVSLVLPFGLGFLLGGSLAAGATALLWAGAVRVAVLHHVTWSINSVCHMFGRRPFRTTDRSSNVAALAVVSMGESWHNAHHAFPNGARHGVDRGQWDSSATLIRACERFGWAHDVRWPDVDRREAKRLSPRKAPLPLP
ncbi:acyl-CoA desaturase [soil metagenome]